MLRKFSQKKIYKLISPEGSSYKKNNKAKRNDNL